MAPREQFLWIYAYQQFGAINFSTLRIFNEDAMCELNLLFCLSTGWDLTFGRAASPLLCGGKKLNQTNFKYLF